MHAHTGELLAFIEHKHRNLSISDCYEYQLSAAKFHHGCELSERFKVPFLITVRFNEGLYFARLDQIAQPKTILGGYGVKARDQYDNEPMILIPCEAFYKVE